MSSLFQLKRTMYDKRIIGNAVIYGLSAVFVMNQVYFTCFVAFGGIDICYDTSGSQLDAPDVIYHHSVCNDIKFVNSAVRTDQKLLQCIRDIDTVIQICDYVITVGYSIQFRKSADMPGVGLLYHMSDHI